MSKYKGRHVVIRQHNNPIALVRVNTVGDIFSAKTLGKYDIIYPANYSQDELRRIRMVIRNSAYKDKKFLDNKDTIRAVFEVFGGQSA